MNTLALRRAAAVILTVAVSAWAGATVAPGEPRPGPARPAPSADAASAIAAPAAASDAEAAAEAPAALSSSARRAYELARTRLVQIRTVLRGQDSQTSVGSGFLVSTEGHIITNFHVVAEAALHPERHQLVYVTADGREAPLHILQIDVLHDLALLRAADAAGRSFSALPLRPTSRPLVQGERIYSLGNPLDVGFAVAEGTCNGLVQRSFYPQIFFGGALSPGMSGGPALDQQGQVAGINVARRGDGEQVSFLVPAEFAAALLDRGRDAAPLHTPAYEEVAAQLLRHQATLTERFLAQGWRTASHPRYRVPTPPDNFMRCWGHSEASHTGGIDLERSDCVMDTQIFAGDFNIGMISLRHESYDGQRLGPLRFAARYAASFRNESFQRLSVELQTRPQCREDFVDRDGLTLRAVVCLSAYRKLPELYDLSVLVATLDAPTAGVQGRFDAAGVSFENAGRLARHYIEAFGWRR